MSTMSKEKFDALPASKKVCCVFGTPISYAQYLSAEGYYSHPSLRSLKKRLKITVEELRLKAPSLLHSPFNGGYYESWRVLARTATEKGATQAQLQHVYNVIEYPRTLCQYPGCQSSVPWNMRGTGCCTHTHANYFAQARRGAIDLSTLTEKCHECGKNFSSLSAVHLHLTNTHHFTPEQTEQYYLTHCVAPGEDVGKCLYCGKPTRFRGLTQGYTQFCYNSDCSVRWYNENTDRLQKSGAGIKATAAAGDVLPTQLGYWLKKGYSPEDAQTQLTTRQTTNSVESIAEREGINVVAAKVRRREITEKWLKNRTTGLQWSCISQVLFWDVWECIQSKYDASDVFFATFDVGRLDEMKNREFKLRTNRSYRLPDFFIKSKNVSIEFDGAYHHSANSWRGAHFDKDRDAEILEAHPSHRILHVREADYRKTPQVVLKTCLDFILQS